MKSIKYPSTAFLLTGIILCSVFVQDVQAKFIRLSDDLVIHYKTSGRGRTPIIFTPGWLMSSEVFLHQLDHFRDSMKYQAIAYDPRAQGLSSRPEGGHTYQQHARDLRKFIEKLEIEEFIFVGWSFGVAEQLSYINQFGSRGLKALILVDGAPKGSGTDYDTEWIWHLRDDSDGNCQSWTEGVLRDDPSEFYGELAEWMVEQSAPEVLKWISSICAKASVTAAALLNETAVYLDYEQDLIGLDGTVPLLYVVREEWRDVVGGWAKTHTPSAEVAVMGKHMMFWERYEEFNRVVDRFLQQLE